MQDSSPGPAGRFQAVIFDCDGVLVDSEPISARTLVQSLAEFGFRIDLAHVHAHYLGRSFASIAADYAARTGAPLPEGFLAHWQAALFAAFRRELRPIPGIHAALDRIALPRAVVSSSRPERLALCLELCGLTQYFAPRIFSAALVARAKPAPDLFNLAAAALGCAPERILAIEDSASGVAAGRAAGMAVWGFTGGSPLAGQRDGATLRAAGAERIFGEMEQLHDLLAGR